MTAGVKFPLTMAALLLIGLTAAASASPVILDFSAIPPGGIWNGVSSNRGTSLTFAEAAGLTLTARSTFPAADDPLFSDLANPNKVGTLYWGDLGNLDDPADCGVSGKPACIGIGVQDSTKGGSKGISGGGPDAEEAAVFTWADAFAPAASSVKIGIIGYANNNSDANKNDVLALYLEFLPSTGSNSDFVNLNFTLPSSGPSIIDISTIGAASGKVLKSVGIMATSGHFGIGSLSYDQVPEPSTLLIAGAGLVAVGLLRRRKRKV